MSTSPGRLAKRAPYTSRIQDLTKRYSVKILVSEIVFDEIECRFIDTIRVKGKKKEVSVYEILEGDIDQFESKLETGVLFDSGIIWGTRSI